MNKKSFILISFLGLVAAGGSLSLQGVMGCNSPASRNSGAGGGLGSPAGETGTGGTPGAGSITSSGLCTDGKPTAFRGAEGFGACLRGGRGGNVYYVTSTDVDVRGDKEGTLQWAVNQPGPKYIVFSTSGLISQSLYMTLGDTTIAGQTSPGGITIKGGVCDGGIYERDGSCGNVVIRFLRSRPIAGSNVDIDDGFRLSGVNGALLDHVSLENASDEQLEISRSQNITVQNSIFGEAIGDHYENSGVLLNYSKNTHPQNNISLHHNLWTRVGGRYPEMSCEENPDGPGTSNCTNHTTNLELNSNVIWDLRQPLLYNRCTGNNEGNDCSAVSASQYYNANIINVYGVARSTYDSGLVTGFLTQNPKNKVFLSGNQISTLPLLRDIQLACQSDDPFPVSENAPPNQIPAGTPMAAAHAFPAVTATPVNSLLAYMRNNVGSFPRDTMDNRITGYLFQSINSTPQPYVGGVGVNLGQALLVTAPTFTAPADTDRDGMPDCWETRHGLNTRVQDHNGMDVSDKLDNGVPGCMKGYPNLECYLNQLAEIRVSHPTENYTQYVCP